MKWEAENDYSLAKKLQLKKQQQHCSEANLVATDDWKQSWRVKFAEPHRGQPALTEEFLLKLGDRQWHSDVTATAGDIQKHQNMISVIVCIITQAVLQHSEINSLNHSSYKLLSIEVQPVTALNQSVFSSLCFQLQYPLKDNNGQPKDTTVVFLILRLHRMEATAMYMNRN